MQVIHILNVLASRASGQEYVFTHPQSDEIIRFGGTNYNYVNGDIHYFLE